MEQFYCYTFSTFLFLAFLVYRLIKPARSELQLPPGPWQLPIIGSIHHVLIMSGYQPMHRVLSDLSKSYGRDLMHLKLGEVSHIVASSPRSAEEILKTHDVTFATRPLLTAVKALTYNGRSISFAPYGGYWRQLRRICVLELLSPRRIHSFGSVRREEVQDLVSSVSQNSSSANAINVSEKLRLLTANVMARAAVGNKHGEDDQKAFPQAQKEAFEISGGFDLADLFPSWSWLLSSVSGHKLKVDKCQGNLDRIFDSIIRQRTDRNTSSGRQVQADEEDLLDVLLRLQQHGGLEFDLTTDRIKAVLLDVLGAGAETSATILDWAMSELMRNPRVMRKAQSEVREIVGEGERSKVIAEEDVAKLDYLRLVIKETLRLHAPGPLLLPRECQETCEILGYRIPKKARVLVNVGAIARDPLYWEDAGIFKPERFEANGGGVVVDFRGANFEFLPFGAGRRMCPGLSFGLATVELALAQLLYSFNWELPQGTEPHDLDMSEAFGLTAGRKSDLWLRSLPHVPCPADALQ